MQRWTSVVLGLFFAASLVGLLVGGRSYRERTNSAAPAAPSAKASSLPRVEAEPEAGETEEPIEAVLETEPVESEPERRKLPESAPQHVGFGVILFKYQGAQGDSSGRSRDAALKLAEAALAKAKEDFAAAVKLGDPGSTENAGRMPRGVLEPKVEYALFTLKKDAVHPEVLDTPRGLWIVRRTR